MHVTELLGSVELDQIQIMLTELERVASILFTRFWRLKHGHVAKVKENEYPPKKLSFALVPLNVRCFILYLIEISE